MRNKTWLGLAVLAAMAPAVATAQVSNRGQTEDIIISQADLTPLQIAVVPFTGMNGPQISDVISGNLKRSGFFSPLNPASFVETGLTLANSPNYPQWTSIGAQAVLYGGVTQRADGRVDVGFRLYDPYRQCQLVSYQFTATAEQWRRMAHKISDVVYQRLTGEQGYFDSRVLFVAESGSQTNRRSRLTIVDQDGYNPVFLTQGDEVIMSPRFSTHNPDEVTYVALGKDYSRIYLYNLATGRRESLGEFDGQVLAPRFSHDGSKMAFSIIRHGNTDVYVINLRTRQLSRLTSDPGIDTSPSFSPDGSQIVFTSDRSGSARLYTMRADGSGQRPISRGGGIYTAPAWSPRGDMIAFTKQSGGRFHTGVMNTDGTGERILSSSYLEEGASWAPNGRYVMFARQSPGGDTRLWTVDLSGRVVAQAGYTERGSSPAWSGLLDAPPANLGVNQGPDSCAAS
ncbi:Tol-Pal system beta propeller repeat protein TolB [Brevundimonas sp. BH3]|nr:Tol-Pal system beta propeller repeat protein TolB [Brevundimonas sp.]